MCTHAQREANKQKRLFHLQPRIDKEQKRGNGLSKKTEARLAEIVQNLGIAAFPENVPPLHPFIP